MLPFYETLEDPDRPGRMKEEWTSDGDIRPSRGTGCSGSRRSGLPRDGERR